jgi:hypothetical protein
VRIGHWRGKGHESKQALLFCEQKRSKKNFDSLRAFSTPREAEQKFFASFFQKRSSSLLGSS